MANDIYAATEKHHKKRTVLITILIVLLVLPVLAWSVLWLKLNSCEKSHALLPGIHCGMSRADFWYTVCSVQELVSDRDPFAIPGFTDPENGIMRIATLHSTGAHGAHFTDFPDIWRGL